jgi:L-fuconolactonase
MFIVDSQVHIWAPESPEEPWPKVSGPEMNAGPQFSADDLLREMDAAGVARAVLVPPAHAGNRNELSIAAAMAHPDRFAVMGRLALDQRANRGLIDSWMDQPGIVGMRLNVRTEPGRSWLSDGTLDWFWPAAERTGIPLMIHATGVLDRIGEIAHRHPGLKIAIDHLALHRDVDQKPYVNHATLAALCEIAIHPNIAVKASALPYFSAQPYPFADLHAPIRQVFDAYGPRRVFWGTDLTRRTCTYTEAVELFTKALPWLGVADQQWVMGRALCEWLDWPA